MQIFSLWSFGFIAVATVLFFGMSYPLARKLRTFWAWATGTEAPKEKMVVFLPLNLMIGLLVGGFAQSFYDAAQVCGQYQQPLIPCTFKVLNQPA